MKIASNEQDRISDIASNRGGMTRVQSFPPIVSEQSKLLILGSMPEKYGGKTVCRASLIMWLTDFIYVKDELL